MRGRDSGAILREQMMVENAYKTPKGRRRRDRLITMLFLGIGLTMCIAGPFIAARVVGRPWNDPEILSYGLTSVVAVIVLWRVMLWFVRRFSPHG